MNKIDKYFYGVEYHKLYNSTINAVVPLYSTMIELMHEFVYNRFSPNDSLRIQDVGAGTGCDSLPILKHFENANLQAWDLSQKMKNEFKSNAKILSVESKRYSYDVVDYLNTQAIKNRFDLTVSGYCIHHYELKQKVEFFKRIFESTKLGGYFILKDLVNFKSNMLTQYSHDFDIRFIENSFDKFELDKSESQKKILRTLRNNWIHHMNNENILNSAEEQMKILNDLGFKQVECVYKYLQHVIIIAIK